MSEVDETARYSATHEWVKRDEDDMMTIGISDHAQSMLGDVVFIELPEVGREVRVGEEVCVVESVKAASDIYAPMSGEVIEVNESLMDEPGMVNQQAYEQGWIFKLKPYDIGEWDDLLSSEDYLEQVAQTEGA